MDARMLTNLQILLGALILSPLLLQAHLFAERPAFASDIDRGRRVYLSEIEQIIARGFEFNDRNYLATKSDYAKELGFLATQLVALQNQGREMACSDQMLVEARWLLEQTTEWTRLDAQLGKLARSLPETRQ